MENIITLQAILEKYWHFKRSFNYTCRMHYIVYFFIAFFTLHADERPHVIFVNGTSSSGKSSIIQRLLDKSEQPYLKVGIDWYLDILNPRYVIQGVDAEKGYSFIKSVDECGRPVTTVSLGPVAKKLDFAAHRAMKSFFENGFSLIIDEVLVNQEQFNDYISLFGSERVYFIAIKPPVEIAEEREFERGDRVLGLARGLYTQVYSDRNFDLIIDSSKMTPSESADAIIKYINEHPNPDAFRSNIR